MRSKFYICAGIIGLLVSPAQSSDMTLMQTASVLSNLSSKTSSGKCSLGRQTVSSPDALFPDASLCGVKKREEEIVVVRSGEGSLWGSTPFGRTAFGSGTPFGKTRFASGTPFGRTNGHGRTSFGTSRFGR